MLAILENPFRNRKPEFGNPEQINYLREFDKVFKGEINCDEIDWEFGKYIGNKGETRKPAVRFTEKKGEIDCVYDYIKCPRCNRLHLLVVSFAPEDFNSPLWQQTLITIDESVKEFQCWNCKLEFETEDRLVYVKKGQRGWI